MISLSEAQLNLLQEFESGLDPQRPEQSAIAARVLGYGEISTVFAIEEPGLQGLAFKRLPLFHHTGEVDRHRAACEAYTRMLQQELGLRMPEHGYVTLANETHHPVFYIVQQQLPAGSIGHQALHLLPVPMVRVLIHRILQELHRLWNSDRRQDGVQVGIDGQISNWSIDGFDPHNPRLDAGTTLSYLDTSTPFLRIQGVEQMNAEVFLRSAPSFLRWILRLLFLEDVVNRYYDFRRVAVDLAANFYREQRADLIPDTLRTINHFFANEASELAIEPISDREVRSYYREDAFIWRLYLSMRKLDRTIHTRLLHKEYPYILPGKIKR
jgi:hypothetical protein